MLDRLRSRSTLNEPLPGTVPRVRVQFWPEPPMLSVVASACSSVASMLKLFIATPETFSSNVTANTTWVAFVSWPTGVWRVIDVTDGDDRSIV